MLGTPASASADDPQTGCNLKVAPHPAYNCGPMSNRWSIAAIAISMWAATPVEQKSPGPREPVKLIESFDGLGVGFSGPELPGLVRNPSDNSLAVGPDHIVQIVNSRMAVFDKKGQVLHGPALTNTIFKGFGGQCENRNNGDAVVRYDQLADRWLFVMPIFTRPPGEVQGPYSMCYAVTAGTDPHGPYHRYEFKRALFPDYPRPAVWPDGYYNPTSTGDTVIQKHACVADRAKMLEGLPATEQCIVIDGVNFLNNADIDGHGLPPPGAPNIMMAAGGTQLKKILEDDGIFVWKFHVDWQTPANTKLSGPVKIPVAPYHYLCDGQLTNCVPQPGTDRRLDAQGDKIMQRLVYRNVNGHESIVAVHSVNTETGGGVRWYEFRLDKSRDPQLYQQSTYAPDGFFRWMASPAMDRQGNIGIGYSFGGTPNFPGQRFAARLADDPLGVLTFRETVLVNGEAAQTNTMRWEDYTQAAMDPSDDCTIWYVGDYIKKGATNYSTRIGAFRLPGCLRGTVNGSNYFDLNRNGRRDAGEPGLGGREIQFTGGQSGTLTTDVNGNFHVSLPADSVYFDPTYSFSTKTSRAETVHLKDREEATSVNLGSVCEVRASGARDLRFWSKNSGSAILRAHNPAWRTLVNSTLHLMNPDGSRFTVKEGGGDAYERLRKWLRTASAPDAQFAAAALNFAFGDADGNARVHDPVVGDWPTIHELIARVDPAAGSYVSLIEKLNNNSAMVTPSSPARCPPF